MDRPIPAGDHAIALNGNKVEQQDRGKAQT
jgi:hypothetical protein